MVRVSATEFQRNFGRYEDRALVEPVTVSRHGRDSVVLISKDAFDRLMSRTPQALLVSELTAEDIARIER